MFPLISAHITHKEAPMQDLGRLGDLDPQALLSSLRALPGVDECALLKTCNRVEFYVVSEDQVQAREGLERLVASLLPYDREGGLVRFMTGRGSMHHLMRVSCGLESLIVGEDQIQSQVKECYDLCMRQGCMGKVLGTVFRKAISTGKRVRTETRLNKGNVSVGSAAVDMAEARLGDLHGRTVLVIGAGQMATLIAKHLLGKGPQAVFVSNRTYARAMELAWCLNGKAVRFEQLQDYLERADVVLCATSAKHIVLGPQEVGEAMRIREGRPMFIIDVSFPRNVAEEVCSLPGVEMCDLSGLNGVARENLERRRAEILEAEAIIKEELQLLTARLEEMRAAELLRSVHRKYQDIKLREVQKAMNRLRSGEESECVLEDLAGALVSRFLADPTAAVKMASRCGDAHLLRTTRELFALEEHHVPSGKDEKD
jgi:glutamyl-tRNA reductase